MEIITKLIDKFTVAMFAMYPVFLPFTVYMSTKVTGIVVAVFSLLLYPFLKVCKQKQLNSRKPVTFVITSNAHHVYNDI